MKKFLARLSSLFGGQSAATRTTRPVELPQHKEAAQQTPMFEPVNDLERLLVLATTDTAKRPAFKAALLEADLFAATPEAPKIPVSHVIQPGEKLAIMNAADAQGKPIPAVFTAKERVAQAFGPDIGFVRVNGEALLDLFTGSGVVLNPGLSFGVLWTAEELSYLLGKMAERTIQEDTQVLLGVPSEPPNTLVTYLQTSLAKEPLIDEAWLALAHWPKTEARSWYLDVRSGSPADDARRVMAPIVKGTTFDRYPVDLIIGRPGAAGNGIRIKPLATH